MYAHSTSPGPCSSVEHQLADSVSSLPSMPESRRLVGGEIFIGERTVVESVAIVLDGLVGLRRRIRGRAATLMLLRRGSIVDDSPMLGIARSRGDAVAITDATVLSIPVAELWSTLHGSVLLSGLWITAASCRFSFYQRRLVELLAGDIRAKVAALLLHATDDGDATALTHQMMAELLGVQRSSVSRVLADFERSRIVSRGYAHLRVHDRAALERAAWGRAAAQPTSPQAALARHMVPRTRTSA